MKALVSAFNQEKALVGAFPVIVQNRWIVCSSSLHRAPVDGGMRLFAGHQSDMIYGVSIQRTHWDGWREEGSLVIVNRWPLSHYLTTHRGRSCPVEMETRSKAACGKISVGLCRSHVNGSGLAGG